ncbi:universal stress protein UspE [Aliidiomarina sedimenti]|uniref:Universal stress protein UspE n=1 Tax=Aliidiomarina sedimenti TaxID=1933879 RepID=A0ABY0C1N1_9GAMM|nr:universal stress protein UspE [Aliidiomarina sedimenti]RUO31767.1 universal stress protein UspE [Aliidiomarina sedimenti]
MYNRILVVLDPNQDQQKALARAVKLARLEHSALTLFVSIYDFSYEMTTMLSGEERENMRKALIEEQREWAADLLKAFDVRDLTVNIEVVWHHRPFEAIIKATFDGGHDLIIKGTRRHDKLQSVIFTPTDWHLLRKAPCPVLLVKEHEWPPNGRIIGAVNAGAEDESHQSLNERIIAAGKQMSEILQAELHLLNCYPTAPLNMAIEIPEFDTSDYQANVRDYHQKSLATLADRHHIDHANLHVREGLPEDQVPALAEKIDAELVVLGTIGRTGFTAALLGNTAEHVIEQLNCDVLAIKPEGFKSPLKAS